MNLNPLTWLLVLAPAAVIGALLFVWVYQSNSSTADLERDHAGDRRKRARARGQGWRQGHHGHDPDSLNEAASVGVRIPFTDGLSRLSSCRVSTTMTASPASKVPMKAPPRP